MFSTICLLWSIDAFPPSFSLRLPTCPWVLEELARAVGIRRITWMTAWHQDYPLRQWCRAKWAMVRFSENNFLYTSYQDPRQYCYPAPYADCSIGLLTVWFRPRCMHVLNLWFLPLTDFSNAAFPARYAQLNPELMATEPFFISQLHAPNFAFILFLTHH